MGSIQLEGYLLDRTLNSRVSRIEPATTLPVLTTRLLRFNTHLANVIRGMVSNHPCINSIFWIPINICVLNEIYVCK